MDYISLFGTKRPEIEKFYETCREHPLERFIFEEKGFVHISDE